MTVDKQHTGKAEQKVQSKNGFTRKQFMKNVGGAMLSGGLLAGLPFGDDAIAQPPSDSSVTANRNVPKVDRVAADPTDIPSPISRNRPVTHDITLESKDLISEIEPGVEFKYMTYGGKVPGPMIRVRQGDK
ncbi:MAG: hypothetical protein U5K69_12870 [Balneolaceae bacterium]|nr:hypothetical protein [Balneolaceae bacterium]